MNIINKEITVSGFTALLTGYVLDSYNEVDIDRKRPCILILPGGGYEHVSNREAECVAVRFAGMGYQCFVLRYSVAPSGAEYPVALAQAMKAMKYLRDNRKELHLDPDKISVMGFSAGGHLAADLSCEYDNKEALALSNATKTETRPSACVLCYPVITSGEKAHKGSFIKLLGKQYSEEMKDKLSLEKRVTSDMPPVFIWHTFEDATVPVENSLYFAAALKEKNIPCEMHIFPFGSHGLSVANLESAREGSSMVVEEVQGWPELADRFLKQIFNRH